MTNTIGRSCPSDGDGRMSTKQEKKEREIALSFFRLIAPPEGPMAALRIFDPKCRHHNPYCAPGMKALFREMAKVQQDMEANKMPPDPVFKIKHVMVDGKMVVIHTTLQSKSKRTRGFRQIHMFRFKGDKVVEYWDVTQMVPKDAKYPKNMF
jgi:predicted SnoaL-like aldol condensation-catalyzing enzyme